MQETPLPARSLVIEAPETHSDTHMSSSPENRSALFGGTSPRGGMDHEPAEHSTHDVLERLKEQVASVMHARVRKDSNDNDSLDLRSRDDESDIMSRRISPQSLLAASMHFNPPSLVPPAPRIGFAEFAGGSGDSPSPTDNGSPQDESAGLSPRQANGSHAPWNYEEQFKQLYEIDDNPKRREFLEDIFRFMHTRGTPINRLPIMAKQVLDLYELFNLVVARGGLVEVINKKLWQEIIKGLKLPSSITSAAFTLRTQYMKYLYPYECHTKSLSSPAELQAAIDGNRREGRRSSYNNNSYADFIQRSPLMPGPMHHPQFGLPNGLPGGHHPGMPPLSLINSRPGLGSNGSNAVGHPLPPNFVSGSPFLPGMGTPVLPSANDTLLTLWSLYNKRNVSSPPLRKQETFGIAPQSEALNLEVRKEMARQEMVAERERERAREAEIEREAELERERRCEMTTETLDTVTPPPNKRNKPERDESMSGALSHTKMNISTKGDSSMVVSMELDGVVYQGVLFAQPAPAQI